MSDDEKPLLVVTETFALAGRGVILSPRIYLDPEAPRRIQVRLKLPGGATSVTVAKVVDQFVCVAPPSQSVANRVLVLDLPREAVPVGTEVWRV